MKEIIGYNVKNNIYADAAKVLEPYWDKNANPGMHVKVGSGAEATFKGASILDLWFTPVYKEEEFKVGDIVKIVSNILYSNEKGCNDSTFYNIGRIGRLTSYLGAYWQNNNTNWCCIDNHESAITDNQFILASLEEIKKYENNLLLEEAKKRYPVGSRIKLLSLNTGGEFKNEVRFTNFKIFPDRQLYVDGNLLLFDGKNWAEILPSCPQITINGYSGEFFDEYVKFGCAKVCSEFFIQLFRFVNNWSASDISNKFIESVTIGRGAFSKEQIKEIAEYYLNKK